jgi:hypothetical protein
MMISGVVGMNNDANIDNKGIAYDQNNSPTSKNSIYQGNVSSGIKRDGLAESR